MCVELYRWSIELEGIFVLPLAPRWVRHSYLSKEATIDPVYLRVIIEALKSALVVAKEAEEERASHLKHESRVEEVQQELKDAIGKCESLERKSSEQNSELAKTIQSAQEARAEKHCPGDPRGKANCAG